MDSTEQLMIETPLEEARSSTGLLKHGTLMFIATSVVNVMNWVFHIYMGRALGPVGYGVLASLLSLLMIVSVPAGSLQAVITRYVARFRAKNQYGQIRYFLTRLMQRIFWYCLLAFLLFVLLSGIIASFLRVPSRIPVVIMGSMVLISLLSPVANGGLQGLQNFKHLGANMIAGAFLKLVFGVAFVALGLGVNGAIAALTLSGTGAFLLALIPLRFLRGESMDVSGLNSTEIKQYFWPVVVALLSFSLLSNIDIVMVKHFFSPTQAGNYAAAAIFGKIVLFFPGAVAMVMFPKTAELHALELDPRPLLKKSLLAVGGLCSLVTAGYFLFPFLIVSLLFGARFYTSVPLMGLFGIAMTLFSLVNILVSYYLSIHSFRFIFFLASCTLLEIALLWFFHPSLQAVVYILIGCGFLLLALSWANLGRRKPSAP
jgi:O-antigen/teichoic acid export membrane protein